MVRFVLQVLFSPLSKQVVYWTYGMVGVLHSLKQRARQCPFFSARTAQPSAAALWLAIAHLASRPLSVIIGSSGDRCAALDAGLLWPSLCATLGAEHFCQAQGRLWCRVADVDWSPLPKEAGLGVGSESWLVRRQEAPLPGWSRRLALTAGFISSVCGFGGRAVQW